MKVWFDSQIIDSSGAEIDSEGWPAGTGVFETLRTENGQIYELARHMRRAGTAAKNFGYALPSEEIVREAISQLLKAEPQKLGRLRLLFSRDHFVAVHQGYTEITTPAFIKSASDSDRVDPISYKTFPYDHRTTLLQQAKSQGFDEVILINSDGFVTEGAVSNFIFFFEGRWITTPLSAGVLPGVQRGIAVERCGVRVESLKREDLAKVSSILVISSLKIALPASHLDGRNLLIDAAVDSLVSQIRAQTQAHSVG